jgi:hypothetical protein
MVTVFDNAEKAVDALIAKVGKKIVVCMPVALGKPNDYINALYDRAVKDPSIDLTFISALVPEKPKWGSDLERRMLEPLHERFWSKTPVVKYFEAVRNKTLPSNIHVFDIYTKSGAIVNEPYVQKNMLNWSYTYIAENMMERGANVCASLFSKRIGPNGERLISGGGNTDLWFEMARLVKEKEKQGIPCANIGQITDQLPFLYGRETGVHDDLFDFILDGPDYNFDPFPVPKPSVSSIDHMIGIHASTVVKDGGTIQIGIGALADAIVNGIIMRHTANSDYQDALKAFGILDKFSDVINKAGGYDTFKTGLFVNSEMLVEPFLELAKRSIVKRKCYDHVGIQQLVNDGVILEEKIPSNILERLLEIEAIPIILNEKEIKLLQSFNVIRPEFQFKDYSLTDGKGLTVSTDLRSKDNLQTIQKKCLGDKLTNGFTMNAAFFLGSAGFYKSLREMDEESRKLIRMNSVLEINQLYGNEKLRRLQRRHARYMNIGMYATLMGGLASDMLEDGRMISGVGGQFNFVEQALQLKDGRSVLMLKSTKGVGKNVKSNIRFSYGHITIPRYLRDIVITEYGIVELQHKSDAECIASMLNIADSRFQEKLLAEAKAAGKIASDYQIPAEFRNNYPEVLEQRITEFKKKGFFQPFPFGTEMTKEEVVLGGALKKLKNYAVTNKLDIIKKVLAKTPPEKIEKAKPYLERMKLTNPTTKEEHKSQKLVMIALELAGVIQ